MRLLITYKKKMGLLYNLMYGNILDRGAVPRVSTNLDADYKTVDRRFRDSSSQQIIRGRNSFDRMGEIYKTARRGRLAPLSNLQTITANSYEYALAA